MFLRKLLLLAVLMHGFEVVQAQSTRADAAARTTAASRAAAALDRAQAAPEVADTFIVQAEADLGTQELIRERPRQFGAYLIGTAGLFYTSNPSLSNDAGRGDLYFVGGGGAGLRPNVVGGLYLDGHVSDQVFQYAQFSSLNFNYFNAGGGLDYVFEGLGS